MIDALRLRGLGKKYGGRAALDEIDLRLGPGEVHGLLGPNGAGKSTLLGITLGLVRPDQGSVELLGQALVAGSGLPDGVAGFVDSPRFPPELTARTVLRLLTAYDDGGVGDPDALLASVGLTGVADRRTGALSLGMRQRLAIAAALARRPRVLVLDEPANGLDLVGLGELVALLRELAKGGTAILLSSHDVTTLARRCASVSLLAQGRMVWSGTLAELERQAPTPVHLLRSSNDRAARAVAASVADCTVTTTERGLEVVASPEVCDRYVLALAADQIAVRSLSRQQEPLEAAYLQLVGTPEPAIAGAGVGRRR